MGVGIVGANWAARGHLPAWRLLLERVNPLAVCTTRPDTAREAARRLSLPRSYHAFADMLDDPDIDIVSLGAPPPARFEMTMAALRRDKHVFSCVPFAVSGDQAEQMAELQKSKGLVGAVDAYFIWTPGVRYYKQLLDEHYVGELYEVSVDFSMGQFVDMRSDYAYRWTGASGNGTGVVPNSCSHVFHTLIHLFGDIDEVVGVSALSKKQWTFEDGSTQIPEVADTAVVLAKLAGGALVNIHAGRAVPSPTGFRLSAYGSAGRLVCESPGYPLDRSVTITGAKGKCRNGSEKLSIPDELFCINGAIPDASISSSAVSMGALFSNFLESINSHTDASPSFTRAAHVQTIVDAVRMSELTRSWQAIRPEVHRSVQQNEGVLYDR